MTIQKTNKAYTFKVIPVLLLFIWLVSLYGMGSYGMSKGLRPLIRNMGNKIVLYKTRDFKEIETDTFIFRYEDIDGQILELIKDTAENKYKEIKDVFQYEFKDKILIVVYNNADLMMETTMLRKGDPPMGVYYGNSVHILNPELWVKKTDELRCAFCNRGPMLHELVHLFTDHIGNGNFPMWFTEGVSLYFEYMIDDYEWGREVVFTDTDTYTIEELNSKFYSLNQYKAYTRSFRLVKNMVDNYGLDKLIDTITLLGEGHNLDEFIYLFEKV